MNPEIKTLIDTFSEENILAERKDILNQLADFIKTKVANNTNIHLNFICTHNSRRSHLSQIWAQTMAHYWDIKSVYCYSGGTEATAMFYKVVETLSLQGFEIIQLSETANPVYAIKYDKIAAPLICFSKTYQHPFNPSGEYAAIVTCNSADEACPVVWGSEERFSIKYDDPKMFDNTDMMDAKYRERSLQIAEEMWFVFSQVK